jgi:hypothetical protein
MPIPLPSARACVFIRKEAFERAGLLRTAIDERFTLTPEEFRVEGTLVVLGPLPSDDMLGNIIAALEENGLTYFDDFFELSGNWPEWLTLYAAGTTVASQGAHGKNL